MKTWKLGCNWGRNNPDFYEMIKEKSIVICSDKPMKVNEYVAICRGFNVVAIAKITDTPKAVTDTPSLESYFKEKEIDYEQWNKIANATYYELSKDEQFKYKLQQGICSINNLNILNKINTYIENKNKQSEMNKYIKLIETNKNIILTGSPGTGKTFLAKQIARKIITGKVNEKDLSDDEKERFDNQCCFVQFHPSYDYTDFVEGLRAEETNGQVGFNLHNGIFKKFCKKAIAGSTSNNFDSIYQEFIENQIETDENFQTPVQGKVFRVEVNSKNSCNAIPTTSIGTKMTITKQMLYDYVVNNKIRDWKPYTTAIGNKLKEKFSSNNPNGTTGNEPPFVFIIDEINRGELSKIFGELFFSIDPGYRGTIGKVQTQYANIQSGDTIFDETLGEGWFYVPENVYIIATMNDIDRSVESMDFAMRRRFSWIEIKAKDRTEMWDGFEWKEEATQRMSAINNAISTIDGLSSAYHIGPAYFLNLRNDSTADKWNKLWEYHIQPLVKEYLRGMPDSDENLQKIKQAYDIQ